MTLDAPPRVTVPHLATLDRFAACCMAVMLSLAIANSSALANGKDRASEPALESPKNEGAESGPILLDAYDSASHEPAEACRVWMLSTRSLCRYPAADDATLPPAERLEGHEWQSVNLDGFIHGSSAQRATVVFVHGYDTTSSEARRDGLATYRRLGLSGNSARQNARFVIWSWPSQRTARLIPDAKSKSYRTNIDAHYLALFINRLESNSPVVLIGYSYGARIVTGALHLLGGGKINGRPLAETPTVGTRSIRGALFAAAVEAGWLAPGHAHGAALTQTEELLVTVNPRDRVLRWNDVLSRSRGSSSLGLRGLGGYRLGDVREKVTQINVSRSIGSAHLWHEYLSSCGLMERVRSSIIAAPSPQVSDDMETASANKPSSRRGFVAGR